MFSSTMAMLSLIVVSSLKIASIVWFCVCGADMSAVVLGPLPVIASANVSCLLPFDIAGNDRVFSVRQWGEDGVYLFSGGGCLAARFDGEA